MRAALDVPATNHSVNLAGSRLSPSHGAAYFSQEDPEAMKYVDGYVCAFGNQHLCFESGLSVSDWASWVQAVGSVCAILASAGVVWWQVQRQHRHQIELSRETQVREEVRLLNGCIGVLGNACEELREAADAFRSQIGARRFAGLGYAKSHIALTADALAEVDASLMSTAGLNLAYRAARKHFDHGHQLVKDAIGYANAGAGAQSILNALADQIDTEWASCVDFTQVLSNRADALGHVPTTQR